MSLRVGVVGCGAVAAKSHLPALRATSGVRVTALADPQIDRAEALAQRFGADKAVADHRELIEDVDALVLALPHHLHAPIGAELLRLGKHVLMEKPLANTVEECDELIAAADEGGASLNVAQVRRYMTAYRAVKHWLGSGSIGEIASFEAEEGNVYNWPVASDFFFRPEHSGGGVLVDTGAHVLDALCWWLGDLRVAHFEDDGKGGVEADCRLELQGASGLNGEVLLSRLRRLDNRVVIHGASARLEVDLLANRASLEPRGTKVRLAGAFEAPAWGGSQTTLELFEEQARQWLRAIRGEPAEIASASEARETIRVIRDAYAMRSERTEPWQRLDEPADA